MTEVRRADAAVESGAVWLGDGISGYLAVPHDPPRECAAVLLGHERYGLVQHTLDLADSFAAAGLVCLAPDVFSRWDGDREALRRGEIFAPLADNEVRLCLNTGLDNLQRRDDVDPTRVVAMGVCQSGSFPFLVNSCRDDVSANVVVYGGAQRAEWDAELPLREEPYEEIIASITAPVLGIWGEDDFVVAVEDVLRLRDCLESRRKSYEFVLFRDMPHGFMNSTMPGRYRDREASIAWNRILDFIRRVHEGELPSDRAIWRFESDVGTDYDFATKVRVA
jgi:carboxymethylenebutenolidase